MTAIEKTDFVLTPDRVEQYEALHIYRAEGGKDDWEAAWECVDLARSIRNDQLKAPHANAFAALWSLFGIAEFAEKCLDAENRQAGDDNGTTPVAHIRGCLDSLALRCEMPLIGLENRYPPKSL